MVTDPGTTQLIPLPKVPLLMGDQSAVSAGLRRFGIAEGDLGVDFSSPNRAVLVTRVLELCTVDPLESLPDRIYDELSIGNRINCLLLLATGGPDRALNLVYKCAGCGEELEIEITLGELSALQREADLVETVGVEINGRRTEFRKPIGRDQQDWSRMVFHDERDAAAGIIGTLAVTPDFMESNVLESLDAIEEALDEADPLVNFSFSVRCEECGELNEYPVDLLETALGMLNRAQNQLIIAIHRLALHYHWTEKEIFAVPEWRRREYLKLIEAIRK